MRSYKRDRAILIIKEAAERYTIQETGFVSQELEVAQAELKKVLRKLARREFPRSRKLRLYALGEYREAIGEGLPRKRI